MKRKNTDDRRVRLGEGPRAHHYGCLKNWEKAGKMNLSGTDGGPMKRYGQSI